MQKIKIGVSSCLLGERVRYDGGHKLDHFIANTLAQYVDFVPVTLINHYARKYASAYLLGQYYLNPHPLELQLRNHA